MEIRLSPGSQAGLDRLVNETGRSAADLIEDAMSGYLEELNSVRRTLDSRFDELESGAVPLIPAKEVFESLRAKSAARRAARA